MYKNSKLILDNVLSMLYKHIIQLSTSNAYIQVQNNIFKNNLYNGINILTNNSQNNFKSLNNSLINNLISNLINKKKYLLKDKKSSKKKLEIVKKKYMHFSTFSNCTIKDKFKNYFNKQNLINITNINISSSYLLPSFLSSLSSSLSLSSLFSSPPILLAKSSDKKAAKDSDKSSNKGSSKKSDEKVTAKKNNKKKSASVVKTNTDNYNEKPLNLHECCLGLDISRYSTGWCIINVNTEQNEQYEGMNIIDYGFIDTSFIQEEGQMLIYLEQQFTQLINKYKPTIIIAEQQFVGRNAQTGLVLAGIHAILKLVAAKKNINIRYYPVLTMKSVTLGGIKLKKEDGTRKTGKEIKKEVQQAIFILFNNVNFTHITDDVTDAISAVVTYVRLHGQTVGKQSANIKTKQAKKKEI